MIRHKNHNASSQMSSILAPEAKQALPKNYHKDNLKQMKNMEQEMNRQRELQEISGVERQAHENWKMKRF